MMTMKEERTRKEERWLIMMMMMMMIRTQDVFGMRSGQYKNLSVLAMF